MKPTLILLAVSLIFGISVNLSAQENYKNHDFSIEAVEVVYHEELGVTVWKIMVEGMAGNTRPVPAGQFDGAPVLVYVFPTSLDPTDVGFGKTEGIVALALTSHPDFDDTPLWDENNDMIYDNDGLTWHSHWVILVEDERVNGGYAVKEFASENRNDVVLPPTNPGMNLYLDSPGYAVKTKNNSIKTVVPNYRINNKTNFSYDAITAFMKVNTSQENLPVLGVYEVYNIASGDLSLPYEVKKQP